MAEDSDRDTTDGIDGTDPITEAELSRRLEAVKRAIDEFDPSAADGSATEADRVTTLTERVDTVEADLQAIRGYLDRLDSLTDAVETDTPPAVTGNDRRDDRAIRPEQPPDRGPSRRDGRDGKGQPVRGRASGDDQEATAAPRRGRRAEADALAGALDEGVTPHTKPRDRDDDGLLGWLRSWV